MQKEKERETIVFSSIMPSILAEGKRGKGRKKKGGEHRLTFGLFEKKERGGGEREGFSLGLHRRRGEGGRGRKGEGRKRARRRARPSVHLSRRKEKKGGRVFGGQLSFLPSEGKRRRGGKRGKRGSRAPGFFAKWWSKKGATNGPDEFAFGAGKGEKEKGREGREKGGVFQGLRLTGLEKGKKGGKGIVGRSPRYQRLLKEGDKEREKKREGEGSFSKELNFRKRNSRPSRLPPFFTIAIFERRKRKDGKGKGRCICSNILRRKKSK